MLILWSLAEHINFWVVIIECVFRFLEISMITYAIIVNIDWNIFLTFGAFDRTTRGFDLFPFNRVINDCFTSNYDHKSILIHCTSMASSRTWFLLMLLKTSLTLRFNKFPLSYKLKFSSFICFFYYFNAIQVVEDDIAVSLATENINLIVDLSTRMRISSFRDITSLNTLIPSEFPLSSSVRCAELSFLSWVVRHGASVFISAHLHLLI